MVTFNDFVRKRHGKYDASVLYVILAGKIATCSFIYTYVFHISGIGSSPNWATVAVPYSGNKKISTIFLSHVRFGLDSFLRDLGFLLVDF